LFLPGFQILPDEQVREFAGGLLGQLRALGRVVDVERRKFSVVGFDEFDHDILTHAIDFLVRS